MPINTKEIQAGYLVSSNFKDIYLYLAQNKLPSNKAAIKKVEALADKHILLDLLLFKIVSNPEKESAVLVIPENCIDRIIHVMPEITKCAMPPITDCIVDI